MGRWRSYLGLPHILGADPDDGQGADCLLLAFRVLDELRQPHPTPQPEWFEWASKGNWGDLERLWQEHTESVSEPVSGSVTLLRNPNCGLGVAVVIADGLLMVHHRRGVCWAPLHSLKPLTFSRFI
jgi:hypothetical protein